MILNIACLTRKPTTRESRSEYLNGFSSAIMKHKRLVWKYDTWYVFSSKMIKQASTQSNMASNMVMVHDNIHIHRISKLGGRESVPD